MQLEGVSGDFLEFDYLELLMERLLGAPSPSHVCLDPRLLHEWVSDNRLVISELSPDCPHNIRELFNLISFGQLEDCPDLRWQIHLAARLYYTSEWMDVEDIHSIIRNFSQQRKLDDDAFDSMAVSLLTFDFKSFIRELDAGAEMDELRLLIAAHLGSVIPEDSLESYFEVYGMALFDFDASLWRHASDYCLQTKSSRLEPELERPASRIIQSVANLAGIEELMEFCEEYDLPKTLQACLLQLSKLALARDEVERALDLASKSSDRSYFNTIVLGLFKTMARADFLHFSSPYVAASGGGGFPFLRQLLLYCELERLILSGGHEEASLLLLDVAKRVTMLPTCLADQLFDQIKSLCEGHFLLSRDVVISILDILNWAENVNGDQETISIFRTSLINKHLKI